MAELRMKYEKVGRAKYLSHLDVMRTFARSFLRAGLPLKHSEGFNPHPYLSIAHPLPVGVSGMGELLDFETVSDDSESVMAKINAALPEGIHAVEVYVPEIAVKKIVSANYEIELVYDVELPKISVLDKFFASESIPVTKKTKRGTGEVNLRESYREIKFSVSSPNTVLAKSIFCAENAPINPKYFIDALKGTGFEPDFARFIRREFLDFEGKSFR